MAAVLEVVQRKLALYETEYQLDQIAPLNLVHEKLNGKFARIHILLVGALISLIVVIQLFGLSFISNLFAFIPLYASFKALRTSGKEDDEYWLTYWVVYGTLSLIESFIDGIFFWMPFYFLFKIVFLVWCFHPASKGSAVIYHRVIEPLFIGIEKEAEEIERTVNASRRVQ